MWVVIGLTSGTVLWFARSPKWGVAQTTGLACGALTQGAFAGFLAPVPEGADPVGKYVQNAVLLALAIGISVLARKTVVHSTNQRPDDVGI
jgi:hypothetical protein